MTVELEEDYVKYTEGYDHIQIYFTPDEERPGDDKTIFIGMVDSYNGMDCQLRVDENGVNDIIDFISKDQKKYKSTNGTFPRSVVEAHCGYDKYPLGTTQEWAKTFYSPLTGDFIIEWSDLIVINKNDDDLILHTSSSERFGFREKFVLDKRQKSILLKRLKNISW